MEKNNKLQYNRIILKISGEAIAGESLLFDLETVEKLSAEIVEVQKMGIEIGLVIGGGNIIRGEKLSGFGFNRNRSDYMGMLATVINGLLFENVFLSKGVPAVLLSALKVETITESIILKNTSHYFKEKTIIIFVGGTGNPFFTTDTAAALRACEIEADVFLKATKVDGVFDKDPAVFNDAKFYRTISYDEVLKKKLKVMDMTAVSMCRDNRIPVIIFNMHQSGNIKKIVTGDTIGTTIKE